MAERTATLGQVNDRITEIDDLIFKGITGQIPMTAQEKVRLEGELAALMDLLATAISKHGEHDYKAVYDAREKVRWTNRLAVSIARCNELHPEPTPEATKMLAAAWQGIDDGTKTWADVANDFVSVFGSIFIELPTEAPTPNKKGLLSRMLGR